MGERFETKLSGPLGLALLPTRQNREGVLASDDRPVRVHLKSLLPDRPDPDAPVFAGGGTRPNNRLRPVPSFVGQ